MPSSTKDKTGALRGRGHPRIPQNQYLRQKHTQNEDTVSRMQRRYTLHTGENFKVSTNDALSIRFVGEKKNGHDCSEYKRRTNAQARRLHVLQTIMCDSPTTTRAYKTKITATYEKVRALSNWKRCAQISCKSEPEDIRAQVTQLRVDRVFKIKYWPSRTIYGQTCLLSANTTGRNCPNFIARVLAV